MNKDLITYEDGLKLIKEYKDFNFSKSEFMLRGYRIVTFTYFLCDYNNFENPLPNNPEIKGYDMRGATFVFNKDGSLFESFYMLSKFFNLNQVPSTQYDLVKNKKIRSITEKEDGSLIAFMYLPDKTIFAKTIGGFNNEQSIAAMKILNKNTHLFLTVSALLYQGFVPMFEYVSFDNRIVLKYSKPELRYIGCREFLHKIGEFVPAYRENNYKILATKRIEGFTLDELIEKGKVEENKEGWVVEFEDGQLIKIKVDWYFNMHGIRTVNIFREDYVIRNYLEEKLDDIICQLDPKEDKDAFKFVERVKIAVENKIKHIDFSTDKLVDNYINLYDKDWIKYATNEHKSAYFGLSKTKIEKPDEYLKRKIEYIINSTKKLNKAKFFVDKWSKTTDKTINKWKK